MRWGWGRLALHDVDPSSAADGATGGDDSLKVDPNGGIADAEAGAVAEGEDGQHKKKRGRPARAIAD